MSHIEEVDNSQRSAIAKIEAILRFHIRQMVEHYEEVYVATGNGNTSPSLTCKICKASAVPTAKGLPSSLRRVFVKEK